MNHAATLCAILIAEAAIGYPRRWWHPVMAVGALIAAMERRWNRGGLHRQRIGGIAVVIVLIAAAAGSSVGIDHAATLLLAPPWGTLVIVAIGTTGLAQRSLHDHVTAVHAPLVARDLPVARAAVAMIVGRDTATLDEAGVATAAIESLAESFCDGVVAPAFWFLVAGLPGLFAMKAINTADSMIAHRTPELRFFGQAAAHTDDVMNWIPARISGALICLASGRGWRVMVRDARLHASPNGGWPEAAMAGALGRRLGGAVSYDGDPSQRAVLGDGPSPDRTALGRALMIYRGACLILWLLVGGLAWLL